MVVAMTHTQAGLAVGDMILCVNKDELLGADYDTVRYFLVFSLFFFLFISFLLFLNCLLSLLSSYFEQTCTLYLTLGIALDVVGGFRAEKV